MGFGTLFIGYFLLLNVTYFAFTDAICALVMALAFNKLTPINQYFKYGLFGSVIFAAIGITELVFKILSVFIYSLSEELLLTYIAIPRYIIIGFITAVMLMGIESVAREVGLAALSVKAKRALIFALVIYTVGAIIEIPGLERIIDIKVLAYIGVFFLLSLLFLTGAILTNIYSTYMRICMPGDEDVKEEPSRFGFVNKFREHEMNKQKEYAEYKLQKLKKKSDKKKK